MSSEKHPAKRLKQSSVIIIENAGLEVKYVENSLAVVCSRCGVNTDKSYCSQGESLCTMCTVERVFNM